MTIPLTTHLTTPLIQCWSSLLSSTVPAGSGSTGLTPEVLVFCGGVLVVTTALVWILDRITDRPET